MKTWIETTLDGEAIDEVKRILSSKSSGQLVLNVSQGTVCNVVWRERKIPTVTASVGTSENVLDSTPAT